MFLAKLQHSVSESKIVSGFEKCIIMQSNASFVQYFGRCRLFVRSAVFLWFACLKLSHLCRLFNLRYQVLCMCACFSAGIHVLSVNYTLLP